MAKEPRKRYERKYCSAIKYCEDDSRLYVLYQDIQYAGVNAMNAFFDVYKTHHRACIKNPKNIISIHLNFAKEFNITNASLKKYQDDHLDKETFKTEYEALCEKFGFRHHAYIDIEDN